MGCGQPRRVSVAIAVVVAAAVSAALAAALVAGRLRAADPPPARRAACSPCPQRPAAAGELAVAVPAGGVVIAAWLRRDAGELTGVLRALGRGLRPVAAALDVPGVARSACGTGCWRLRAPASTARLRIRLDGPRGPAAASLPARWSVGSGAAARRLLAAAQRTMRDLRSVRQDEQVSSGPGTSARTVYRLRAPDRMAFVTDLGVRGVLIASRDWRWTPETRSWERGRRSLPFRTRSWFRWTPFAGAPRVVSRGRRVVRLAFYDAAAPTWYRMTIERATGRVRQVRMVADGHFMTQRFRAFDRPVRISAP